MHRGAPSRRALSRLLISGALAVAGCAPAFPTPNPPDGLPAETRAAAATTATATTTGRPARTQPSPPATPPTAKACEKRGTPERLAVRRGTTRHASDGLEVRFGGTSHDHYDEGHSELLLDLSFRDGAETTIWLPNATDDRWHGLVHRCVRIVETTDDQVTIDVAPDAAASAPPTATSARFAPCAPPRAPALTDLSEAADGERYHLDVTHDAESGWHPAAFPTMPFHHASRFVWTNLAAFPALTESQAQSQTQTRSLRFTFTIRRHTIEKEPGRHAWRAEYFAELESVCKRAEGGRGPRRPRCLRCRSTCREGWCR